MLVLDIDKVKEGVERGATIEDFAKLEKLSDAALKNKVLEKIGTANFDSELRIAIADEKWEKTRKEILSTLESFATYVEDDDAKYRPITFYSRHGINTVQVPEDKDERTYFYSITDYHIKLLVERPQQNEPDTKPDAEEESPEARKWRLIREQRSALDEAAARAYEMRSDFVKNFHAVKQHSKEIMIFMVRVMLDDDLEGIGDRFINMLGIKLSEGDEWSFETIAEQCEASPERVLLVGAYDCYGDYNGMGYHNWDCAYEENPRLDILYDFLISLGYQMSDEEQQLRDGTHILFQSSDGEDSANE